MPTHSPAPWATRPGARGYVRIVDRFGLTIATANPPQRHNGDAAGNAAMIAAAPDLLNSLEDMLEYAGGAESPLHDPLVVERGQRALLKARGGNG